MKIKKGFTLVELMIVMVMTAIMIAVTIVSLSGSRDRKAVEGEARKFAAVVREAQNYALTGKAINATDPTCGVGIKAIVSGATTFRLKYMHRTSGAVSCSAGFTIPADTDNFSSIRSLLNGVQFASDTASAIYFSVPRGELIDGNGAAITTTQLILLSKGSSMYSVCVYPTGRVEDVSGASCP